MIKFIVLAALIVVAGCSTNDHMTQKQVSQQQVSQRHLTEKQVNPHPVKIQSHTREAVPFSTATQASSTSTAWSGSKLSAKGLQDELPSELLDLIKAPNGNRSTGQAPTGSNGNNNAKMPTGTTGTGTGTDTGTATEGQTGQTTGQTNQAGQNQANQKDSTQYAQQVLDLVNQERSKAGLSSLSMDGDLSKMAMAKAQDMYDNNYFDHNSPSHGSPFDMMKEYGITYNSAGENIAKGQTSPSQVMKDWMNSPGHKANILNKSYSKIGIAFYNNEWVQEFTG
ncbi:SCP-like extracellular [Paenibacillus sp. HJL G12]|uniref:SCP-like extracellular n=1 Tax=Paenibacillus dendrobii TaxID=2691084 RepID=A0A7X3LG49_9BACL|nr:CAP domain-containing protein [Paenibacillus dendrobii]MWV42845.1 SCP-like extracellular [Paenibacillus dendrobii]